MKILWITNILFPEALSLIMKNSEYKASGGWMLGLANSLVKQNGVNLSVATVSKFVSSLTIVKGHHITYYIIPRGKGNLKYNQEYELYWKEIYNYCNPDVVHIHGTEYSHGLAFLNVCSQSKAVISIQGLTSCIHKYYNYGLTDMEILKNVTIRDILLNDSLFVAKRKFRQCGEQIEKLMLQKVKHVIGRTSWDKAHVLAINSNVSYHFCNETLRPEFYDGSCWEYSKCIKHSIFLSQASYPLKGLHQIIKAMPLILLKYPDTIVKIAGVDITRRNTLKEQIRLSGYGQIIYRMIKRYHLEKHIEFLGPLSAEEMKRTYLQSNVFVCPSAIENSPNSLGEAQMLGVPCVASYVGGIPDMIPDKSCGTLYRFDDVEMLAYSIMENFEISQNFDNTNMRNIALMRHHRDINVTQLIDIYHYIKQE